MIIRLIRAICVRFKLSISGAAGYITFRSS